MQRKWLKVREGKDENEKGGEGEMTEKEKVLDLIWKKVKKELHPELKKEGIEHYGDWFAQKKGSTTKRKMKGVITRQVEEVKYYLAQDKKNWISNYPINLKWYSAKTKNYIAVGWLLEVIDEKFLDRWD